MYANKITPKAGFRLNRISVVSRVIQWVLAIFLLFTIWIFCRGGLLNWWLNRTHETFFQAIRSSYPYGSPLHLVSTLILVAWYWNLIRLFRLYQRGLIFAAQSIQVLKTLGYICLVGGIYFAGVNFVARLLQSPLTTAARLSQIPLASPVDTVVTYRIGFLNFDFGTGMDFGPILSFFDVCNG